MPKLTSESSAAVRGPSARWAAARSKSAAITSQPARICGAEATHGALRTGCDADFAVFSGDPLDLTSRPIAVYGNGALLHGGPDAATKTTTKEPK
jgi:predicted amidohydrolase YtcJ